MYILLFQKSLKRALGGGVSGSLAMVTQVCSLMWVRTTMNYQYRNGHTTSVALKNLYREGGIRRFYLVIYERSPFIRNLI